MSPLFSPTNGRQGYATGSPRASPGLCYRVDLPVLFPDARGLEGLNSVSLFCGGCICLSGPPSHLPHRH